MNDDDRIDRYLSDRAESLTLTPGDPSAVMRRGARRRLRRRGALVGGVAVLALVATTVVVDRGGSDQKVQITASPQATASTFDWSTVRPDSGLGYSGAQAQLASGAVYGLSTAPGPVTDDTYNRPATLYRSVDGKEWVEAQLPTTLSASALAASGDTLYALGTAPAGGGTRDLVVASSTDGARSWSSITLPHEVADLEAAHPGQISVSAPTLAALDATHQVASVVVSANLDPTKIKPEIADEDVSWEWTDTGLTLRQSPKPCGAEKDPNAAGNAVTADEMKACRLAAEDSVPRDADGNTPVVGSYTYAELGISPDLAALVNGRTYTYATSDGSHFAPVSLPVDASGWGSQLVAGQGRYTLFLGRSDGKAGQTDVLQSADGTSWAKATTLGGSPMSAGLLQGRPAVALSDSSDLGTVQAQQADGTWAPIDLGAAITVPAGQQAWVGQVAFGPLGLAASVGSYDKAGAGDSGSWIVHTSDGSHLSVLDVASVVDHPGSVIGLAVSADAITVRLSDVGPGRQPSTPPTQTVLVGTPG